MKCVKLRSLHHTSVMLDERKPVSPPVYRAVYKEFLPDPKIEWRNAIREKLERLDMFYRRKHIDVPEFYVGSIVAVTTSNPHATGKLTRFVGICLDRDRCGLRACFVLRNLISHQGVEVLYDMYDPTIQKVEVLRLEKRLDDKLYYLRDALQGHGSFDVGMEPETLPEGVQTPVNDIKVCMKPRPWTQRWERMNFKGIDNESVQTYITDKMKQQAKRLETPWEKFDLMKEYRKTISEEEKSEIYAEIYSHMHHLELMRKKMKKKKTFIKPTKLA